MRVLYAKRAEADVDRIRAWLREQDVEAANTVVGAVIESVERLREYPELGHVGPIEGTRQWPVLGTEYVVYYRVRSDELFVARVRHGARRPLKRA